MKRIIYFAALLLWLAGFNVAAQDAAVEGLREINGTQLFVKVIGEGEPLLVIHGGPGLNHEYFLPHLLSLARDHKLIFYDQRSTGRSAIAEMVPDLAMENMVKDIHALKDSLGLDKINVLAHSAGTRLALNYVLAYPADVKSVVLVSPVPLSTEFTQAQMEVLKSKTRPEDEIIQDNIVNSQAFKEGDPKVYEQLLKLSFKTSFADTANLSKLNLELPGNFLDANKMLVMGIQADRDAYNKDMYPLLAALKKPVLIIHGEADVIVPAADEKLKASLPMAELVTFSASGHFSFIEEPEKFTKTVSSFLKPGKKEDKKAK